MQQSAVQIFEESSRILAEFISTAGNIKKIENAAELISTALLDGNKIISCGNGGSMSDAMHFAEELSGRFRGDRKALAAIAISDPAYLTCVANDYGYDKVFSRFVESNGNAGDVLLAISTSGNSENIIQAALAAKERGMTVVALTGKTGGKLAALANVEIRAPHSEFADRAQEIHIKVIHCLIQLIEQNLKVYGA
jgi:D-sedoheptulose 7-phosphate isomerase